MKKKLMTRAAAIAAMGTLLISCASDGGETGDGANGSEDLPPMSLTLSSFFPAEYPMGELTEEWAQAVTDATGGRVTIEVFASGSLTPPGECYQGVVDGVSDICHTALTYTPGRFPVMEIIDIPGWEGTGPVTSQAANELYHELTPAEFDDTEVMFLHAHPPGALSMRDTQITEYEQLQGEAIRTTGLSASIYERFGAQIVTLPAPESYDPISRGVVDGTLGSTNGLKYYRLAEVTNHTTIARQMGYTTAFPIVMNKDVWAQFSSDEQERIAGLNNDFALRAGELWDVIDLEGIEFALENGHEFNELSAEESQRWYDVGVQPVVDAYIDGSDGKGFDGAAVWELRAEIEQRLLAEFPPYEIPEL